MEFLGFFEVLAEISESAPQWMELAAGMFVARLADDVVRFGVAHEGSREYALRHVIQVADSDAQAQLRRLLDETAPKRRRDRPAIVKLLLAYGLKLHLDGLLGPASDVFHLLSQKHYETEVRLLGMLRRAFALRLAGKLEEADSEYVRLMVFAATAGNRHMELEAELGLARVVFDRGDVRKAEAMTVGVVNAAKVAGDHDVFANASIDLARAAGERDQPDMVLYHSANALQRREWTEGRDRTLVNVAFALRELDRAPGARRVASYVLRTTRSVDQKSYAMLVLYAIATDQGIEREAREWRSRVAASLSNPWIESEYYQSLAREHATFERFPMATAAATKMLAVAERHQLNKMIIRADEALYDLRRGLVPAIYRFRPTKPSVAEQSVTDMESSVLALCPA